MLIERNRVRYLFTTELEPTDVPAEVLQRQVIPIQVEIEGLPSETIEPEVIEDLPLELVDVQPEVVTTVTKRTLTVVKAVQQEIEEVPTEFIRDITDEEMELPSDVAVQDLPVSSIPIPEEITQTIKVAPEAKKPTSPWEAPEDFEIVFERVIDTNAGRTEMLKPEDALEDEAEALPTYATSTAQVALYETAKPTSTMTFKVPETDLRKKGINERIVKLSAKCFRLFCFD